MRNWFAVGVKERQSDATQFRKEELCCPYILPIKSITMNALHVQYQTSTNVERTCKRGNKENILGWICIKGSVLFKDIWTPKSPENQQMPHCHLYVASSFPWAGSNSQLSIFFILALCTFNTLKNNPLNIV